MKRIIFAVAVLALMFPFCAQSQPIQPPSAERLALATGHKTEGVENPFFRQFASDPKAFAATPYKFVGDTSNPAIVSPLSFSPTCYHGQPGW